MLRGHTHQVLAGWPLGPISVLAMSCSGRAMAVSWPARGCDQYSAKRPVSLLPSSGLAVNRLSLLSRALGSNTSDKPSRSGLACSAARTWRVMSSRRS
ncbi:hypothetical protein D3C76_1509580 [compost metagenome]